MEKDFQINDTAVIETRHLMHLATFKIDVFNETLFLLVELTWNTVLSHHIKIQMLLLPQDITHLSPSLHLSL